MGLPPGPRSRLLTTLKFMRAPYALVRSTRARHGDPFTLPLLNGEMVVTGRPELIEQIWRLGTDETKPYAAEALGPILGPRSLIVVHGAPHRAGRKLLTPPFHGERMRAYAESMVAIATRLIDDADERFSAAELANEMALQTIVRVVFGVVENDDGALGAVTRELLERLHPAFLFSEQAQTAPLGLGPWARVERCIAELDRLLRLQIEKTRERGLGEDILSLLLQATDEDGRPMEEDELLDQLRTLLIAGHETTSLGAAWALFYLHTTPDALTTLREELDAAEDETSWPTLPILKAVCEESLRLNPLVPEVPRLLTKDMKLGDYELPAGTGVAASALLAHHNPEVFVEPERFMPSRFVGRSFKPNEYLPFGGGFRRCIGAAFALYEMRAFLATVLRRYELELVDDRPLKPARRQFTLGPKGAIMMRKRARS